MQEKNGSDEFALISCDIHDCFTRDPKIQDFRFNTIEAARDHYYKYKHRKHRGSYPRFNQQRIRGSEGLLRALMHDIRNDYDGPIKELSKNIVKTLKTPAFTQEELAYNGQTMSKFKPNNIIDRLWYTLNVQIADLPRYMKRETFLVVGGLGSGVVGAFGLWIGLGIESSNALRCPLALLFCSIGSLHHCLKNDEAKYGREFSTIGKVWPYPIVCLVGWLSFNSLKSQLLYAAMPVWFHLYDRLGMFIKPPTVQLPFNTLYTAWPARMRRAAGERWNNSNTIFAAMMKYLLDT